MPVQNLFKKLGLQWMPDADSVGAPDGVLLRADNLVPDAVGALALRRGSALIYPDLTSDNVNSLHTVELADGTTYRVAGIDNSVFVNGAESISDVTGSGDISFGDDSYQIFMARGTTKKKFDGTHYYDWGVTQPSGKVLLSAVSAITKSAAAFDSTESPATSATEGSSAAANDYGGTGNAARELTPASATSRGTIQRLFTTDQDFFNISGAEGSSTDLFDMYVKFEDPSRVMKVKVAFGCSDSSTVPFQDDRFEFTFDFTKTAAVELRDPDTEGYTAYRTAVSGILNKVDPKNVTKVQTPNQVKQTFKGVGNKQNQKSGPQPQAGVWGHLSVTRGQFQRIGSTATRGWDTVRGFSVTVENQKGYTSKSTFSDALMIGGGDRSLTGTYKCVVRAMRTMEEYIELSPPSSESKEIILNHQTLQITIPSTMLSGLDPQADQLWVYLFGGLLDTYYRFEVTGTHPVTGMTMDELTTPDGSDFDDADERSRLTEHGMTMQAGSMTADLVITVGKSDTDALTENERLEPYQMAPPDNIVAIAGPWNGRIFTMTEEGYVYPSSNRSPSSFNSMQVIDLTKYGNPLWMVKTGNGIVCGCEKDVILLAGSGDDSDDLTQIDLYPQPLNIGNPPIDKCATVNGNIIFYRSADGLMSLTGADLSPVPLQGTTLLWRGQDRYGVSGLNTTGGRFRIAVDNLMLYLLAPEGTDPDTGETVTKNVLYRYSPAQSKWSRLQYPQVNGFLSILSEPDGTLIAGDDSGNVWQLDVGDNDEANDIPITILSPIADGGDPLAYKQSHDLQIHCDTSGDTGLLELFKDGSATPEATTYDFVTSYPSVYRHNLNLFGKFLKAQVRITGAFSRFVLSYFDITYRAFPQHSMKLDTGYLLAPEPGDIIWMQEVEFDSVAYGDVTFELWLEDVLAWTKNIDVTDGVRIPYRIPLPRGSKAYRPRLVFYSADSEGEGLVGFEVYKVRVRARGTGNQDQNRGYMTVYPIGQAD